MELRRAEPFYMEVLALHPILRLSGRVENRNRRHQKTIGHLESLLKLFSSPNYLLFDFFIRSLITPLSSISAITMFSPTLQCHASLEGCLSFSIFQPSAMRLS